MSTSPFELFRRNLKPFMIFATLLALVSFVILPILQTSLQQQASNGGDAVVAKYNGTELTQNRVSYFTQNHQSTVRFLRDLANETISRGGVPRTAGFQYDAQSKQIQSLGINQNPSPEGTIRTFMFAAEAKDAGFELDDSALQVWLERFTDGVFSNSEIISKLMQTTQNQMGPPHLYEQLRNHLLADVYLRRGNAVLFGGDGVLLTPDEQWGNFLKLNQNAVVSTYGVLVNDYLDQTETSPSESRIREVYEEGKERPADDQSIDPGFYRLYSAKYEYLVGNFRSILDEEIAKLSDEEIEAEYQRRLKGGDFQLPEDEPASEDMSPEESEDMSPEESEEGPAEEPAAEAAEDGEAVSSDEKPADAPEMTSGEESTKSAEAAATKEPAAEKPAAEKPKVDEPKTETPKTENPATEKPATEKPKTDPGTDDSSATSARSAAQLVAVMQDEDQDTATSKDTATKDTASKDTATEDAAKPAGDGESTDAQMTETEPATQTEPASDETPAEPDAPAEPNVQPIDEVRQEIATALATPAAEKRLDNAITKATTAMRTYFSRLAIHQSNLAMDQESEPPARPDLEALGAELGLSHEVIGPHTEVTIGEEPIAESFEVGTQFGRRGPSFTVMMYGFDNGQTELPKQPMFAAIRTADDQAGKIYVSWKVEETEAYTPKLDEVRDEVVMAIRMAEARELASKAAAEIAEKAKAGTPLADLVPDDKKENLKTDLGPFTWMDSFGFQGATIGNVPELDSVGEEFMSATFGTDEGGFETALNQPGRVVYVIQPTKFEPSKDELQRQFKQPVNRMMARMIASDVGKIRQGFYEALDEETGFEDFLESDK